MPHATMKLIPGIDTNKTPALNEAAFSESQLIRFVPDRNNMGLVQKIGGWIDWAGRQILGINELHPWQDNNADDRLAIGADAELSFISSPSKNYTVLTPQVTSDDISINPTTTPTINISTSTVTVAAPAPPDGTPVVFTTTGTLPTPLVAGTTYYSVNSTNTTFQISSTVGGFAIPLSGSQTGTPTLTIPTFLTTSGSSTVTIVDTSLGVQSVTFSNGSPTVVTAGYSPQSGTEVVFIGASLPSGVTAGVKYYAQKLTATTFNLTTSAVAPFTYINTTSTGSGTIYTPDQIRVGYTINLQTPVSISNLLLSGVYNVTSYSSNKYYSIYTISVGTAATATSSTGVLPTFAFSAGFSYITVTEPNHPYIDGSIATFLYPTTANGVTVYGNYVVSNVSSTQYTIFANAAAVATTTVSMNNGAAHIQYFYNIPSAYSAGGYGTGQYGYGGYGQGQTLVYPNAPTITTTDWVICNFGEILVANPEAGPIYYWSPTSSTTTAQLLTTAPLVNHGTLVTMPSRQLVAYGSTLTGIQDPLLVRWSDAGDLNVWQATANNQAGSYRIPEGSTIVGALQGPQQVLIWTDLSLWSMQYVGAPLVFSFNKLADGVGLIGKKAAGVLGNAVYWMSPKRFNVYAGNGAQTINCPVWDRVFQNINLNYVSEIRCATNSIFNEVTWYYPSASSTTNDMYVKYNTDSDQWDYGELDRVAWADQSVLGMPLGATLDGYIYQHEMGYNNGNLPIISSFKTGYMQLNEADNIVFVDQIWPDFKWQTTDGETTSATVYITFWGANYPGDTPTQYGPFLVTQTTQYVSPRIRNRLLAIEVSTSPDGVTAELNTFFRIGALRYRFQLDGRY